MRKVKRLLATALPRRVAELLKKIGEIAAEHKYQAFVVGGFVRDLLLGVENLDLDIVIEGSGIDFAQHLVKILGGRVRTHEQFATAVVTLPDDFKIDIATARTEFYEFPAALPKVSSSSIKEDLYRRDFTINAMAIRLDPAHFGELLDFFGGWKDLKNKRIRVLYNLSFVEDPTRIFRAIRFEQRYHFRMDKDTEKFIQNAITHDLFERLTDERLREEIILILSEDNPWLATERLRQFDLLRYIHPKVILPETAENMFKEAQDNLFLFTLPLLDRQVSRWLVYFLLLIDHLTKAETGELINRFRFTREESQVLLLAKAPDKEILDQISREAKVPASLMYDYFIAAPVEVLLYQMVKTRSRLFKKRTADFLNKLSRIKLAINGDDLRALGYTPGPLFREILRDLLKARLDGRLKTRAEEIQFVVDKYPKN